MESAATALIERLEAIVATAPLPLAPFSLKIVEPILDKLAFEASRQWTANFNPRPITAAEFKQLYRAVAAAQSGQ